MLTLEQIPMRQDNYTYALISDQKVIMIDPSEEQESLDYFAKNPHLSLEAIICTHSHIDHVGGNEGLWNKWKCPIYGPYDEKDRVPHCSHPIKDGDEINLLGMTIRAHDVRAHTAGHTAYFVEQAIDEVIKHGHGRERFSAKGLSGKKVLFVGDSLFAAGCGRLFEGTVQNLVSSLHFYRSQDENTLMACAHEYTQSNLTFAREMLPSNEAVVKRQGAIEQLMELEGASVPCLFKDEFSTNPFLLALSEPTKSLMAQKFSLKSDDLDGIIKELRLAKDNF